jgi:hypothetical protein
MERISEEQMWEVIDGLATPEIFKKHEQLMLTDAAYKAEFQQYTFLEQNLQKLDLEVPSMRFTENVIETVLDIKKQDAQKDWSPMLYLGAMVVFSAALIKAISTISTPAINPIPIDTEGFMSFLVNPYLLNGFLILNVIALFMLLDKKVLKPYFEKKLK